jgi:maltooligosyltrehalose trehalohydrolase
MGAVNFWELIHQRIREFEKKSGQLVHTIAESDLNSPKVVKPIELGGWGFTAQWLDDFHHAIYTLVHEEGKKFYADFGKPGQVVKAIKDGFVHSGEYVKFRKRKFGASSAGIPGEKFIVFSDNHDQAGNRATGARLTALVDFEKIKLAAATIILSPYIPMLFMGEEYGEQNPFFYFTSHSDPELIKMVEEGRRSEFEHFDWSVTPPDCQDEKTFLRSKLKWNLGEPLNQLIHQWYKELIGLRKSTPALQNFNKENLEVESKEDLFVMRRSSTDGKQELVIIFNFSSTKNSCLQLSESGEWKKILDSKDSKWKQEENPWSDAEIKTRSPKQIAIAPLNVMIYQKT